ncbi:MAG: LysM peptidoglycan-binding domain-containing protein [Streptococcaceae bacterium]|jgi:LysM repeat protein|nr:LysM peptidoglycan-binding domain-containing protein [Streptococcaceae bacterium]
MSLIETSIAKMNELKAKGVTYSMTSRNGPNSYDCSSSVGYALGLGTGYNTESIIPKLTALGYELIFDKVDGVFDAKRGDVVIWSPRNGGSSLGAFGHIMIMTDGSNMIHCNYGYNGVTINNYDYLWAVNGKPRERVFRFKTSSGTTSSTTSTGTVKVAKTATNWSPSSKSGKIPSFVLGQIYSVLQTRAITYSRSTKEYLVGKNGIATGWLLEQDIEGFAGTAIKQYTVVKGDTLAAIAKKLGTTWQNLAQLNSLTNPNIISIGQKLRY